MPPSLPTHPDQRVDHADAGGQDEQRVDLDLQYIAVVSDNTYARAYCTGALRMMVEIERNSVIQYPNFAIAQ